MYIYKYIYTYIQLHSCVRSPAHVYTHTYTHLRTKTHQKPTADQKNQTGGGGGGGSCIRWIRNKKIRTVNSSLKDSWLCVHRGLCWCVFLFFLCVDWWRALEVGHGEQKWASESIIWIFVRLFVCLNDNTRIEWWSMGDQVSNTFLILCHYDGRYRPSICLFVCFLL